MTSPTTAQIEVPSAAPQSQLVRHVNDVLSGSTLALFLVAALFFTRFYRRTHDRLFLFFALAFAILGINGIIFQVLDVNNEARTYLYAVRVMAFLVIIYAIADKNLARRPRNSQSS